MISGCVGIIFHFVMLPSNNEGFMAGTNGDGGNGNQNSGECLVMLSIYGQNGSELLYWR